MPASELHGYVGNAGTGALAAGIGPSDNTFSLTSATVAATYPTGSDGVFYVAIDMNPDESNAAFEKVKVTSRSGVTFSGVSRGQDGTVAKSHAAGAVVKHVFTADDARIANKHAADPAQGLLDHPNLVPPTASSTVTTSNPGDAAVAGVATNYARGDHKHAREAAAAGITYGSPAASAVGDASNDGTGTAVARANHVHAREAFGSPSGSAIGDTTSAGTATTPARSDHRHAREAFGSVTAQTNFGASSNDGTATTVARSDHRHGTPLFSANEITNTGTVTTTSTSYTDLSGAGPSTSMTVGPSGVLQVVVSAAANSDGNASALIGFTLSGTNTRAAADLDAFSVNGTDNIRGSRVTTIVGLTPGVGTVITAVYKSNAGANTASFSDRKIAFFTF